MKTTTRTIRNEHAIASGGIRGSRVGQKKRERKKEIPESIALSLYALDAA